MGPAYPGPSVIANQFGWKTVQCRVNLANEDLYQNIFSLYFQCLYLQYSQLIFLFYIFLFILQGHEENGKKRKFRAVDIAESHQPPADHPSQLWPTWAPQHPWPAPLTCTPPDSPVGAPFFDFPSACLPHVGSYEDWKPQVRSAAGQLLSTRPQVAAGQLLTAGQQVAAGQLLSAGQQVAAGQLLSTGPQLAAGQLLSTGPQVAAGQLLSAGQQVAAGQLLSAGQHVAAGQLLSTGPQLAAGQLLSTGQQLAGGQLLSTGQQEAFGEIQPAEHQLSQSTGEPNQITELTLNCEEADGALTGESTPPQTPLTSQSPAYQFSTANLSQSQQILQAISNQPLSTGLPNWSIQHTSPNQQATTNQQVSVKESQAVVLPFYHGPHQPLITIVGQWPQQSQLGKKAVTSRPARLILPKQSSGPPTRAIGLASAQRYLIQPLLQPNRPSVVLPHKLPISAAVTSNIYRTESQERPSITGPPERGISTSEVGRAVRLKGECTVTKSKYPGIKSSECQQSEGAMSTWQAPDVRTAYTWQAADVKAGVSWQAANVRTRGTWQAADDKAASTWQANDARTADTWQAPDVRASIFNKLLADSLGTVRRWRENGITLEVHTVRFSVIKPYT
jgi:hypothetical protein